jgi:hypothetical protein
MPAPLQSNAALQADAPRSVSGHHHREGALEVSFEVGYATVVGGRWTSVVCSPAGAWGKVVKLPAIADV